MTDWSSRLATLSLWAVSILALMIWSALCYRGGQMDERYFFATRCGQEGRIEINHRLYECRPLVPSN